MLKVIFNALFKTHYLNEKMSESEYISKYVRPAINDFELRYQQFCLESAIFREKQKCKPDFYICQNHCYDIMGFKSDLLTEITKTTVKMLIDYRGYCCPDTITVGYTDGDKIGDLFMELNRNAGNALLDELHETNKLVTCCISNEHGAFREYYY